MLANGNYFGVVSIYVLEYNSCSILAQDESIAATGIIHVVYCDRDTMFLASQLQGKN